jgi:hypothetical protein
LGDCEVPGSMIVGRFSLIHQCWWDIHSAVQREQTPVPTHMRACRSEGERRVNERSLCRYLALLKDGVEVVRCGFA